MSLRTWLIKKLIDVNEKLIFERAIHKFYKKQGALNTVIDVGANKGQSIDFFRKLAPQCRVYAFEPNPALFGLLQKRFGTDAAIEVFELGVSSQASTKTFHENVFDYTSSFEELNYDSAYLSRKAKVLGVAKNDLVAKSYPVQTVALSQFINEKVHEPQIDVVKIDTEGHEYACLQGLFALPVKPAIRFIQIENHKTDMYKEEPDLTKIEALLHENGFKRAATFKHGFGNFFELVYEKPVA